VRPNTEAVPELTAPEAPDVLIAVVGADCMIHQAFLAGTSFDTLQIREIARMFLHPPDIFDYFQFS